MNNYLNDYSEYRDKLTVKMLKLKRIALALLKEKVLQTVIWSY